MTCPLPEEIPMPPAWTYPAVDTEEIPEVEAPHVHRRGHMTAPRPRGAPMFNLPEPPVRYVPVIRRHGFTVEPPSYLPSPVLEAEHSKWARTRPDLSLWGVPQRYEYGLALCGGIIVGIVGHIAWASQAAQVVTP